MRTSKLLLVLALVLVAVFAFASCDCEHDYQSAVTAEATCNAAGTMTYTCAECGDSYTKLIPRTEHVYTSEVVAPTCAAGGYTKYTCSCGQSYSDNYTALKEHTYTSAVTAPTCTEDGYTTYTCSACGNSYQGAWTMQLEHVYTKKETVSPACGKSGYTVYACECGDSYQSDFVSALFEHNFTETVVAPTHTAEGYTQYTCTCGETYKENIVPAVGHTYTETITAPTCTTEGAKTYTCSCGDKTSEIIPATGHSIGEIVNLVEVTCGTDGFIEYKCAVCSKNIREVLASNGHVYRVSKVVPPSCADGYSVYSCTCGASYTDDVVPATGEHIYEPVLEELTEDEKQLNDDKAIGKETFLCIGGCGNFEYGELVYEYMTFDEYFDGQKYLVPEGTSYKIVNNQLSLTGNLYVKDALHLVSGKNTLLSEYSISFDVAVVSDPSSVNYNASTNTGSAKPPIFFALIDGQNKWDYKNPALGLDRNSVDADGAYELRIYRHDWSSKPTANGLNAATGFFMKLGNYYSFKMDFKAVGSAYSVTLYAKALEDADYQKLGTYQIMASYGNANSYVYFEGNGNVYDNFKITAPFAEYVDPETCEHVYKVVGIEALSDSEKKINPYAIGREVLECTRCTPLDGNPVTTYGDALYEFMSFDSKFDNHDNTTVATAPSVSGGKYTATANEFFLTDNLNLVSGGSAKLKDYAISFDVVLNYVPTTGISDNKYHAFFDIRSSSNKWENKSPALMINKDSVNEAGGYELYLLDNSWSGTANSFKEPTGYFMELGEEYSIKMAFTHTGSARTVNLYIKKASEAEYSLVATKNCVRYYGEGSFFVFRGAGNVYDNFSISGAFTEVADPSECLHSWEISIVDLTDEETAANPYAIGREKRTCPKCDTTEMGDALYEFMSFDSKFDNHANTSTDAPPSVSGGKYTATANEFFLTDNLNLVSGGSAKVKDYTISFDVVLSYVPTTGISDNKYHAFFDIRSSSNKWENKSPALMINKDSVNEAGGYELYLLDNSWSGTANSFKEPTGYFMEIGKEYSIKMEFTHTGSARTVTLYIMEAGDKGYTKVATKNCVRYYGEGSFFVFRGAGNTYDNFKVSGTFVEATATE